VYIIYIHILFKYAYLKYYVYTYYYTTIIIYYYLYIYIYDSNSPHLSDLSEAVAPRQEDDFDALGVVLLGLFERGAGGDHGAVGATDHQGGDRTMTCCREENMITRGYTYGSGWWFGTMNGL